MEWIGVLTGDIVDSTKLTSIERARLEERLNEGLTKIVGKQNYELYRGDSFQIVINEPSTALRTAIKIRCLLRKSLIKEDLYNEAKETYPSEKKGRNLSTLHFSYKKNVVDARISIGIGAKGYSSQNIKTSDGEAFQLSGRTLDNLKSKGQKLVVTTQNKPFNDYIDVICSFLDVFINNWSLQQAEVVYELLEGKKQIEIAEMINIKQASVSQRINTAHWQEIEKAINLFEKKVKEIYE
ncbi:hypothetical protein [Rufibacter sp. XAAS-G3-1]|uniref:hypothetical protein n=1 Tax=Rufibacter sp. XAAS-G3-1 TaxID=2729134 RepID=UPI0015E7B87F|nr:hypothetical protein [Rufibacter sp. XAAS-G3-1]